MKPRGGDHHKGRKLARELRGRAADLEDRVGRLTGMIAALETERLRSIVEASRLRAQAEEHERRG